MRLYSSVIRLLNLEDVMLQQLRRLARASRLILYHCTGESATGDYTDRGTGG